MSALGHYLEDEGIPTVQISLVREHTEALSPPRALWVPFPLGRPFGVPDDAAFQSRVVRAALALLERESGPVLEDFPDDAPAVDAEEDAAGLACPVSFPAAAADGDPAARLRDEVAQLEAWHEVARIRRGRTTVGVTGLSIEAIAAYIGEWHRGARPESFRSDLRPADALRLACDELRAFYFEACSAQPGRRTTGEMQRWFWEDTAAGRAIREVRDRTAGSDDAAVRALAASGLVPRAVDDAPAPPR